MSLRFGGDPLLDQADFAIRTGERVCLIGRNGTGKTSLLKIIAGEIPPDAGEIHRTLGMRVARLLQEVPTQAEGSVFDWVFGGIPDLGEKWARHQTLLKTNGKEALPGEMTDILHALESPEGCEAKSRAERFISEMGLRPEDQFPDLSGGYRRRVLLARALAADPDLLLLDEPTNHLDIPAIEELEERLLAFRGALLFVTHDRRFLQRLATRIVELDRGRLLDWPGDYGCYLQRKQEALESEATTSALFDKRLALEEVWIRQGVKARRTRNEGRVRALEAMRQQRQDRRELEGSARMTIAQSERSGKLVIETQGLEFVWDQRLVVRQLTTTILRGDKVGILGPNGCGKTTLLQLLLGQLPPLLGTVRHGTRMEVAYFDQLRATLDFNRTVAENVSAGRTHISVQGRNRHVISYLQDFLFSPERAATPVRALSGGERNRLLLARLFATPSNLLVMDEPTNDLDSDTLELLEELLLDYGGTLLLVSHDRAFLDQVVTSLLVFEGEGTVREYVGGYEDWLRQRPQPSPTSGGTPPKERDPPSLRLPRPEISRPRRMSYREQQELSGLPMRIDGLEGEVATLQESLADPSFYRKDSGGVPGVMAQLTAKEQELAQCYVRWEELEQLSDLAANP